MRRVTRRSFASKWERAPHHARPSTRLSLRPSPSLGLARCCCSTARRYFTSWPPRWGEDKGRLREQGSSWIAERPAYGDHQLRLGENVVVRMMKDTVFVEAKFVVFLMRCVKLNNGIPDEEMSSGDDVGPKSKEPAPEPLDGGSFAQPSLPWTPRRAKRFISGGRMCASTRGFQNDGF